MSSNIIYKYSCSQCQSTYIGETQRHLISIGFVNIKGYPLELACPFQILPLVILENMPLVLTTLLK